MYPYNFHSHSLYCDGKNTIESFIENAIALGFKGYGISSHAPVRIQNVWAMKEDQLTEYITEVNFLQNKYHDKIELFLSLEVDFIKGIMGPDDYRDQLDYVIGSIHYVDDGEGNIFEMDGPFEKFARKFKEVFQDDSKRIIGNYFDSTKELLVRQAPDILGHFDKLKMNLKSYEPDLENDKWYRDHIFEIIDLLKNKDIVVEINTRGMYSGKTDEPYPSYWVIDLLNKFDIPMCLNSDSHTIDQIDGSYDQVLKRLNEMDCKELFVFSKGHFKSVSID